MAQESDIEDKLVSVDFNGLVLGFSSAALYYIGHDVVEEKPSQQKNLPLALQNIEIVKMLKIKTAGNLTEEETNLINEVIKDLEDNYKKALTP